MSQGKYKEQDKKKQYKIKNNTNYKNKEAKQEPYKSL